MSMVTIDALLAQLREAIAAEIATAQIGAVPADIGDLPTLLRSKRRSAGLTLDQVAQRAGTSKSHIWDFENGREVRPSIYLLNELSKALGIPLSHLCAAALAPAKATSNG